MSAEISKNLRLGFVWCVALTMLALITVTLHELLATRNAHIKDFQSIFFLIFIVSVYSWHEHQNKRSQFLRTLLVIDMGLLLVYFFALLPYLFRS